MNLKLLIGSSINVIAHKVLGSRMLPLIRGVPYGFSAWYDAQRIAEQRNQKTIFDVGANIGQTAAGLVRYFPDSNIHCFEPATEPFQALKQRSTRWPNVSVHQFALGDRCAELEMFVRAGDSSELNTLVLDSVDADCPHELELVAVTSLDAFCNQQKISSIDILKLDVQGWEMKVLAGAQELFEKERVKFVFAESAFNGKAKDMASFFEIHEAMRERGFVLSGIYDCFRWGRREEIYFCNCLYTNLRAVDMGRSDE